MPTSSDGETPEIEVINQSITACFVLYPYGEVTFFSATLYLTLTTHHIGPNVSFLVVDYGGDFAKLPCVVVTATIVFTNCFKPQTDGQAVMAWYFWLHTGFLRRP